MNAQERKEQQGFVVDSIEIASQSNITTLEKLSDEELLKQVTKVVGEMQNRGWGDIPVAVDLSGSFEGKTAFYKVKIRCVGFAGI